jgi:hypothetical protein
MTSSGSALDVRCDTTKQNGRSLSRPCKKANILHFNQLCPTYSFNPCNKQQDSFHQTMMAFGTTVPDGRNCTMLWLCPTDQEINPCSEFDSACSDEGLIGPEGYASLCQPCYDTPEECVNATGIGDKCILYIVNFCLPY